MDALLKPLAAVSLELDAAGRALDEGLSALAAERLDAAEDGLSELRAQWPELDVRQRRVLGLAARPVRERLDVLRGRLPRRAALTVLPAPAPDPEEDAEPDGE